MQDKFMFFKNFAEAIRQSLPSEKQAEAYKAICEFAIYDQKPTDPLLLTICLLIAPSLFKTDGRKNNGGNHNPTGKNQHSNTDKEVNSGQSLVNFGQCWSIPLETETETETINRNFKPKTETETKEYSPEFEELWKLYKPSSTSDGHISPKGAKPDAYKAYCKAKKQADAETIKTGVLVYLQSCKETDTYTSHLSTCLNKGYWVIDENDLSLQRKKQQVEIENRILKNQLDREKQNV